MAIQGKNPNNNDGEKLYFLAITSSGDLATQITDYKKHIEKQYASKAALRSPPHITLHMPFKLKPSREDHLTEYLDVSCQKFQPFEIKLDGFGSFEPRVIFINVINSEALNNLQAELAKEMRMLLNVSNANYRDRPFRPHITIAFRDLKKTQFYKAWNEFKSQPLKASFECKAVSLLRHNGQTWDILHLSQLSSS